MVNMKQEYMIVEIENMALVLADAFSGDYTIGELRETGRFETFRQQLRDIFLEQNSVDKLVGCCEYIFSKDTAVTGCEHTIKESEQSSYKFCPFCGKEISMVCIYCNGSKIADTIDYGGSDFPCPHCKS